MGKKILYFHLGDIRKYEMLIFYYDKNVIIWEQFTLYAQDQNGVIKHFICIIIEKVYTILFNACLPSKLWLQILSAICYMTNKLPIKALERKIRIKT